MERATEKIWLARPEMMGNEALYVQKSLESGWITSAYNEESYIGKFERSVEGFLKFGKAVAVNSGTSAIHLALLMAGVQKRQCVTYISLPALRNCGSTKDERPYNKL